MRTAPQRRAVTLVELLVIVGIILILLAMLLPAVQKVREHANRAECTNHLRTMGQGFQLYLSAHQKYFPTGGADCMHTELVSKDFARVLNSAELPNTGQSQNWGWMYQIMPYVGYESLWNLRRGPANTIVDSPEAKWLYDAAADDEIRKTTVPLYNCPSRRELKLVRTDIDHPSEYLHATCDYAGNAGPFSFINSTLASEGHTPWKNAGHLPPQFVTQFGIMVKGSLSSTYPILSNHVHVRDVSDGLAHTLLVAEKAYNSDRYNFVQFGEKGSFCYGFSPSTLRTGGHPPIRDFTAQDAFVSNYPYKLVDPFGVNVMQDFFGSAHPHSMNALFSDGSVRQIKYSISSDPQIRPNLCTTALEQLKIGIYPLPSPPNQPNSLSLTLFQRLCHRADGGTVNMSLLDD